MIAKFFETARFVIVGGGAFFCYKIFPNSPILQLHYFMPCVVLSLSGLSGIEAVFFTKYTAKSLGREVSPYQYQSGMNNLAVATTGLIVFLKNWGVYAEAAMTICTLLFITLSASVHMWDVFKNDNKNRKNMLRGLWTILLLAASLPILIGALGAV